MAPVVTVVIVCGAAIRIENEVTQCADIVDRLLSSDGSDHKLSEEVNRTIQRYVSSVCRLITLCIDWMHW